jgi:amino acid permease
MSNWQDIIIPLPDIVHVGYPSTDNADRVQKEMWPWSGTSTRLLMTALLVMFIIVKENVWLENDVVISTSHAWLICLIEHLKYNNSEFDRGRRVLESLHFGNPGNLRTDLLNFKHCFIDENIFISNKFMKFQKRTWSSWRMLQLFPCFLILCKLNGCENCGFYSCLVFLCRHAWS